MFSHIRYQMKTVAPFLLLMLIISLGGMASSLFSRWSFAAIIAFMYNIAFTFYYVYIIASSSDEIPLPVESSSLQFFLSMFERRLFPFFVIYLVSVLSSAVLRMGNDEWSAHAFLVYFDDRTANMVLYCVLLYYVYRFGSKPFLAIPLFLALSYIVYYLNNLFYDAFLGGTAIIIYKIAKMALVLLVITWNFRKSGWALVQSTLFAITVSIIFNFSIIGLYSLFFSNTVDPRVRIEYGMRLGHYGRKKMIEDLTPTLFAVKDVRYLRRAYPYYQRYKIPVRADESLWNEMLYSGTVKHADEVALYMLKEGVTTEPAGLISYAMEHAYKNDGQLEKSDNLVRLTAQSVGGGEYLDLLVRRMDGLPKPFTLWSIKVLGESSSCSAIRKLIDYLPAYDSDISFQAYGSLKVLTGLRPDQDNDLPYNSVESIRLFRDYYREMCIKTEPDNGDIRVSAQNR